MSASIDSSMRARGRRRDLLVLHPVVARGHLVEDLAHDPDRLPHLGEADGVAVEGSRRSCPRSRRSRPRRRRGTACCGAGPTATPVERRMGPVAPRASASWAVMTPTPCSRPRQIGWLVMRTSYSSRRGGMSSRIRSTSSTPAVGQVGGHAAGADEVVVHPQAGDLLEEAQHLLALAPAVEHHRHRADVHAVAWPRNSRCDAIRFSSHRSIRIQVARGGTSTPSSCLGGHGEHQLVEERRERSPCG